MAIQVCGRQSKTPYFIEAIKTNVYSLEEINFFIFNHINLVYREFFCDELLITLKKSSEEMTSRKVLENFPCRMRTSRILSVIC